MNHIEIAAGILSPVVILLTVFWLHDNQKLWWNRARKWGPQHKALLKAQHSVNDLVHTKGRIRDEERQTWAHDFEQLAGHTWREEKKPEPPVDIDGQPIHQARPQEPLRPIVTDGYGIVIRNMAGKPIVMVPNGVTPTPPAGGGGVSKPHPSPMRMINDEPAYPVRMGSHVGQYVIRNKGYDTLVATDGWSFEKIYEGGHYPTCPYECDCPKWARRY